MDIRQEAEYLLAAGYSYRSAGAALGVSGSRIHTLITPPKGIRTRVYQRAKYACEWCQLPLLTRGHVHHFGYLPEELNEMSNLLLLCPSCHRKAHRDRCCLDCLVSVDIKAETCQSCGSQNLQLVSERDGRATIRIDDDLIERIDQFAQEYGYGRSRTIRILVEAAITHAKLKP